MAWSERVAAEHHSATLSLKLGVELIVRHHLRFRGSKGRAEHCANGAHMHRVAGQVVQDLVRAKKTKGQDQVAESLTQSI